MSCTWPITREAASSTARSWTQTAQIEQKLADLNEHMEKVIQMYLRNEYATIAEYNEAAGSIAEKYHFRADTLIFPASFSDMAILCRLISIINGSGTDPVLYVLLHWNRSQRLPQPPDLPSDMFKKAAAGITSRGQEFIVTGHFMPGTNLQLDPSPDADFATAFIHKIGKASVDSSRESKFLHFRTSPRRTTNFGPRKPPPNSACRIGRTGATKLQYVAIGKNYAPARADRGQNRFR